MALLSCQDLSLGYEGKAILEHISFAVNPGDYLCIVGENGSGKSTLMQTILGLHHPLRGTVKTGDGLKQNEIGYLPQQTQVQKDFPASVWEIVLSITHLKKRCYRELSGGQQQRVLLARALCATKKLLLLDEPVSGLDPKVTAEMYQLIEDLNRKEGITVIMISHDIRSTLQYATHVLHLGAEVFFGTLQAYLSSSALVGLGREAGTSHE